MKKTWRRFIFIIAIVSIAAPIIIGWGVSQDILNNWTNDNDWIGFWGSYIGTMIGSFVTLFVLWSTLEDNRRSREREEKVNYYNNLIEVISALFVDIGNYLALVTKSLNGHDYTIYNLCIQAGNQVAKSSMIADAHLHIKGDVENIDSIIKFLKPIEDEIDEIGHQFDEILKRGYNNQQQIDVLNDKMNVIIKKINDYTKLFPEIIKAELDK